MNKKYLFVFLLILFLFGQTELNEAPNFKLPNLDGDMIELSEVAGSGPVILSFWATWCKPCLKEMTYFNDFYNEYNERGLKLLAISVDSEKSVSKVRPYIRSNGYEFPVLLDTNSEVARKYYAQMVPFTVILNKKGEVVFIHLGYKKGDELKVKEVIEKLLSES